MPYVRLGQMRRKRYYDVTYRGWSISFSDARPVTGKWRAERHGVGMGAGTEDALYRMIDAKVADKGRDQWQ
jgi:hypothetical protein